VDNIFSRTIHVAINVIYVYYYVSLSYIINQIFFIFSHFPFFFLEDIFKITKHINVDMYDAYMHDIS